MAFLLVPADGIVVSSHALTAERLREVGGSRLRAPPVADAASKKAGAAVEIGSGNCRGHRFRAPQTEA